MASLRAGPYQTAVHQRPCNLVDIIRAIVLVGVLTSDQVSIQNDKLRALVIKNAVDDFHECYILLRATV